jgi:hypothetical protein
MQNALICMAAGQPEVDSAPHRSAVTRAAATLWLTMLCDQLLS